MFFGNGFGFGFGGLSFDPGTLFAAGEQGAWYDPSDLSTLFQDSGGTTPVTTAGQPVGKMLDKSGRGNHATQATSAKRPTYQTAGGLHYLAFDGVDDSMATGTITPGVDKAQVFAGVQKLSKSSAFVLETGGSIFSNTGSIFLHYAAEYSAAARGSAAFNNNQRAFSAVADTIDTAVLTSTHDISGDLTRISRNRVFGGNATGDKGTGNFLARVLNIGSRNQSSLFLEGRMYGLILRFGLNLEDAQIAGAEAYLANKAGVTL